MATRSASRAAANLTPAKVQQIGNKLVQRPNTLAKLRMLNGLADLCRERADREPDRDGIAVATLAKVADTHAKGTRKWLEETGTKIPESKNAQTNIKTLIADDELWEVLDAPRGFGFA